MVSLQTLTVLS
jgi:aromatic amino acid aminotransferase I